MSLGHNFDFESYCIVGESASRLQNVYAVTDRYNYAPVFLCIQGIFYQASQLLSDDPLLTYRVGMVGLLTLADLGIMYWLSYRFSIRIGLLFLLNPVSVIISGYHNQFDNLAVLFALLSCDFYNEEEKYNKKDACFILFLTMSILIKHILWIFPFWLLVKKQLPVRKKFVYVFVPPLVFLISFVPFAVGNEAAFTGIIDHVFFYRSFNNAPLLGRLLHMLHIPEMCWFAVFMLSMMLVAFTVCKQSYEYQVMSYLVAMVAFSSAIANQYLVIPAAALCVLSRGICSYSYFVLMGIYLTLDGAGFGILSKLEHAIPQSVLVKMANIFHKKAYCIAAGILFILLVREFLERYKIFEKNRFLRSL